MILEECLILIVSEESISSCKLNKLNLGLPLNFFDNEYKVITSDKFLGLIDWDVGDDNFLKKIVIAPFDDLDSHFEKFYVSQNLKRNGFIKYNSKALFEISFNEKEVISESLSEFQTFGFSGFLIQSNEIKGLIFDIYDFNFQVQSDGSDM